MSKQTNPYSRDILRLVFGSAVSDVGGELTPFDYVSHCRELVRDAISGRFIAGDRFEKPWVGFKVKLPVVLWLKYAMPIISLPASMCVKAGLMAEVKGEVFTGGVLDRVDDLLGFFNLIMTKPEMTLNTDVEISVLVRPSLTGYQTAIMVYNEPFAVWDW